MVEAAPPKAPENFANSVERNEDDFLQPDTTIKTAENFQFKREKVQFNSIQFGFSVRFHTVRNLQKIARVRRSTNA